MDGAHVGKNEVALNVLYLNISPQHKQTCAPPSSNTPTPQSLSSLSESGRTKDARLKLFQAGVMHLKAHAPALGATRLLDEYLQQSQEAFQS